MAEPATGDVALACALLLVDELASAGADAVCISPGSRSTPLALAFVRHGAFTPYLHLDERSAAFFALGRAKATGRPGVLVCTSGTAGANYLPAVIEAARARVPLIVLTADRPPELHGRGANQTIEQAGLYGEHPRHRADTGVPCAGPSAASHWRGLGAHAAANALGPPAGPVHLNVALREPLVPTGAAVDLGDGPAARPVLGPPRRSRPRPEALEILAELAAGAVRGVVLAGTLNRPAPAVPRLAAHLGWPLLAEPTSGLRAPAAALAAGQALLGDDAFTRGHSAELVVQFGTAPTSRASLSFVERAGRLVTVDPDGWPADPARRAEIVVPAEADELATALISRLPARGETAWSAAWSAADGAARRALDALLDTDDEPFEPRLARDVAAALPVGATLVVASSTPVRDLDLAMAPRSGVRVLANRGASGIDGFASTVLGVASAGAPTYALTGDLSFLHDGSGLLWAARRAGPVTFVVLNNGGGGIFDLLATSGLPEHEALFVAPHQVELRTVAAAAGMAWTCVERASDIVPALAAPAAGARLIEVPIDRSAAVRRRKRLRIAVAAAVSDLTLR